MAQQTPTSKGELRDDTPPRPRGMVRSATPMLTPERIRSRIMSTLDQLGTDLTEDVFGDLNGDVNRKVALIIGPLYERSLIVGDNIANALSELRQLKAEFEKRDNIQRGELLPLLLTCEQYFKTAIGKMQYLSRDLKMAAERDAQRFRYDL